METISIESFEGTLNRGERPILLDVRSASEFATGHIPGAVNVPLEEVASRVADLPPGGNVIAVCESGRRATMAAETLAAHGVKAKVLEGSTAAWRKAGKPLVSSAATSWSLDRQVRLGAGALVLTGTVLGVLVNPRWLALSGFVGAGLTFAGLTNVCGMAKVLQKMPWNRPGALCSSVKAEVVR